MRQWVRWENKSNLNPQGRMYVCPWGTGDGGWPPTFGGGGGVGLGEGGGGPGQDVLKIFENCMKSRKCCSESMGCQWLIKKLRVSFVCSMYSVAQHVYTHIIQVTTQARGGASSYRGTTNSILKEFQWKPQEIKTWGGEGGGRQNVWDDLLEPPEAPIIKILSCLTLVKICAKRTIAK